MTESALAIILHQLVFQGMFFAKNFFLSRKLGRPIRGTNREANISIVFFITFISLALFFAISGETLVTLSLISTQVAHAIGYLLMMASVVIAFASLWHLGDSWRVGVIEEQRTELVQNGIYRMSRNPYFLAYILIFAAYTVFLQNWVLAILALFGFSMIHGMIRREEAYLAEIHGEEYQRYKALVPRYLSIFKPWFPSSGK